MPQLILAATVKASSAANPLQPVTNFLASPLFKFITYLAIFALVAVWLAGAFWIFKDARRRIDDPIVVAVCVAAGLIFGPIAWIVYAIARPAESIGDRRVRELDTQILEERLHGESRCSYCKTPVQDDYLVCPSCGRRLRTQCQSCHRPLEASWRVCPYCEADTHPAASVYDR